MDKKTLVGLIGLLLLAACASGDDEPPAEVSAQRLDATRFRIDAEGRYHTPRLEVEKAALLKAAETTLAHDEAHFRILDVHLSSTVTKHRGSISAPHSHVAVILIELVDGEAQLGDDAFPAVELVERLRPISVTAD